MNIGRIITMNLARIIISFTLISTLIGPITADLNATHVFNPAWPPHARFHTVVGLCMTTFLSLISLWLVWKQSTDRDTLMKVAALVPIIAWGSFFIAVNAMGAGVEDRPNELARVFGIPLNLVVAALFSVMSAIGYLLYWRGARQFAAT